MVTASPPGSRDARESTGGCSPPRHDALDLDLEGDAEQGSDEHDDAQRCPVLPGRATATVRMRSDATRTSRPSRMNHRSSLAAPCRPGGRHGTNETYKTAKITATKTPTKSTAAPRASKR